MRTVSRVPDCNLVLNQAPLPFCVSVQSNMLFPDTFIMGLLSFVASLMHLILLIMIFSWIEVYLWLLLGSCGFGIVDSNCVFAGTQVCLFDFLMVFVREVFCHLFCFRCYIDGLLLELSKSGVGCLWGSVFAGAFCYTDDIVLLVPCASALRIMLDICSSFATKRKLEFNANKTQLICFHLPHMHPQSATVIVQ